MITISEFISTLKERNDAGQLEIKFIHPILYVVFVSEQFCSLSADVRREWLCRTFSIESRDLEQLRRLGAIELLLLTQEERNEEFSFLDAAEQDENWLSWFGPIKWDSNESLIPLIKNDPKQPRILHFYGYKGGQARSTVLVMLAKFLAEQGYKILIVDADVEAPSIDTVLEVATEDLDATLMGLCGWASQVKPIDSAYVGAAGGSVDILACRPKSSRFDMDFAAFLMNIGINAKVLKRAALKLKAYLQEAQENGRTYDVVLIDHRTGVAPSVLPLIEVLPGSAVIFVRPDGSSRNVENF
jgi:Mrp family chromosome partitioning ATPase